MIIAYFIWRYRGSPGKFSKWLVPKYVYSHRSNLLDVKLFFASRAFAAFGIFGALFFPTTVAYALLNLLGGDEYEPAQSGWAQAVVATLIIVASSDFCKYWAHRAHHEMKFLWPFHAVHHSADVLTPLTVQRVHPIEPLLRNFLISIVVGVVQGLCLYVFLGDINILTIGGANALYFLFNALSANFRHSHIWISYGRVIEHILISPAQHQIHHSVATKHHDKNYGSMFALWDWMFGTLYIPSEQEKLTFGVSDGAGKPIDQPYPSLTAALILPFKESWDAIEGRIGTSAGMTQTVAPNTESIQPGFSLWLDFLRASAAFTVLVGHMAHIRFTRGDYYFLRDWNVASDAVAVFFVLSGVVIAYAAGRDQTLGRYAFNRISRIYSVLVPALFLTIIFDAIGTRVDMTAYPDLYYSSLPVGEFFWRGLTITNLWTGISDWVRLGTNGPIWSLSYEVGFYLLFGSIVFLKGPLRIVIVALIALLVGIPVLAMFPAWLIGVLVWKKTPDTHSSYARIKAWFVAIGSILILVALKMTGVPETLENITIQAIKHHNHDAVLVYSDEVLWNTAIAICIAMHLHGVRVLTADLPMRNKSLTSRSIRWIAGGSFSLYLVHYPTLHLLDAVLPEDLLGYDLWLLGLTLAICFGFAALFERPLKQYRAILRNAWNRISDASKSQLKVAQRSPQSAENR
ncbi:sterol desaturase family protein [Ruegeria sp. AU67]|uniref:sterol desaturase family protein n=1 Tax=Ruegeria sp. AU67 TaxID=2108530 RepID=UPI00135CDD7B|nr:sterol desaturase family protein [Ruegeria sp. AU67]